MGCIPSRHCVRPNHLHHIIFNSISGTNFPLNSQKNDAVIFVILQIQDHYVFKKILEKCNKEELIAKLLETSENINEKDRIIKSLENNLAQYELQKQTVTYQKETINRLEKDVEHFKEQTYKVVDNLLENQDNSRLLKNIEKPDKKYYPKVIPRFAKQLLLSDSTYRKINQQDISQQTAIHSYSLATIKGIENVVETNSPRAETESLVLHAGHNSIDKSLSGQDAAMQMKDTVHKCMKKLKLHRVAVCTISPVKDGCYCRNKKMRQLQSLMSNLK